MFFNSPTRGLATLHSMQEFKHCNDKSNKAQSRSAISLAILRIQKSRYFVKYGNSSGARSGLEARVDLKEIKREN